MWGYFIWYLLGHIICRIHFLEKGGTDETIETESDMGVGIFEGEGGAVPILDDIMSSLLVCS